MKTRHPLLLFSLLTGFTSLVIFTHIQAAVFSSSSFMTQNAPGTSHEAIPHGVPSNYDWYSKSALKAATPPSADSGYMNFWGQVYVDQSNVRPANTRVSVSMCQLWGLKHTSDSWDLLVNDSPTNLQGGAWPEDFSTNRVGNIDLRAESDGSMSMTNTDGRNAHFWSRKPLVYVGTDYRGIVVACSTKLSLNNTSAADDRAQSTYLLSVGADWRKSDYGCPTVNSATVCRSIGIGRFIKVTPSWQRVIFSNLNSTQVGQFPALPISAYANPDGTYGKQQALTEPTPPTTTPPTTGTGGTKPSTGSPATGSPSTGSGTAQPGTSNPATDEQETPTTNPDGTPITDTPATDISDLNEEPPATTPVGKASETAQNLVENITGVKTSKTKSMIIVGTGLASIASLSTAVFIAFKTHTLFFRR